jgi:hypothetical protein
MPMAVLALPRPKPLQQDRRCRQPRHHCPRSRNLARYTVLALVARNASLGSTSSPSLTVDAKTHAHTHARTRARPTSTPARKTGNEAQRHNSHTRTRTRRALTYETMRAAPRWTREQWRSATKASKRRPSTRCKRKARAKAKGKLPLIWLPCDSFE